MKCPQCGQENAADSRFCMECGSPLAAGSERETTSRDVEAPREEVNCPGCRTANSPDSAFCIECGAPLLLAGAGGPPEPSPAAKLTTEPELPPPAATPELAAPPEPELLPAPSPDVAIPEIPSIPPSPPAQPISIAAAEPEPRPAEPAAAPPPETPPPSPETPLRRGARTARRSKPAAAPETPLPAAKARPSDRRRDSSVTATLKASRKDFTTGAIFAERYQIVEELGQGGMGRVYRALDKKVNEEIAIKVVKAEIASEPRVIERFSNELRNARRISHKNICRMYELLESEDVHFITMEYVPGENLKSFIRRSRRLAVGTAVAIAKQVAEGLEEAHRLGVIHRDLKPQNIMIDREGNVRIMDFGIASSLKTQGMTGQGVMIGTPDYMSPEQVEGAGVDARTDIYALGVVLFEMVTGRVPFEGDTPLSVAVKHKNVAPPDPATLNPQLPESLRLLILKCLEKDKDKRYATAREVWEALLEVERAIPAAERALPKLEPAAAKEITVSFRPKRLLLGGAVVAALAVVGLAVWYLFIRPAPMRRPSPADPAPAAESAQRSLPAPVKLPEVRRIDVPPSAPLEPEEKPQAQPQPKVEEKSAPRPAASKPSAPSAVDVSAELALGIEAFHRQDYEACLQTMRDVLRRDPGNRTAERYLAEAGEKKRVAGLTAPLLLQAEEAYRAGRLEDCLELARRVLALAPDTAQASRLEDQAQQKLAPVRIKAAVDAFVRAWNGGSVLAFYESACQPALYQRIKREVSLVEGMYRDFQTRASQVTIRFPEKTKAEVRFTAMTTAALKSEDRRMVIFEGTYSWSMSREADTWIITDIQSIPARK